MLLNDISKKAAGGVLTLLFGCMMALKIETVHLVASILKIPKSRTYPHTVNCYLQSTNDLDSKT